MRAEIDMIQRRKIQLRRLDSKCATRRSQFRSGRPARSRPEDWESTETVRPVRSARHRTLIWPRRVARPGPRPRPTTAVCRGRTLSPDRSTSTSCSARSADAPIRVAALFAVLRSTGIGRRRSDIRVAPTRRERLRGSVVWSSGRASSVSSGRRPSVRRDILGERRSGLNQPPASVFQQCESCRRRAASSGSSR